MIERDAKRNCIPLVLAPLVVAALLLLIYRLRGIYPFGALTVAQGDLEQQYCAMYAQFYDVLTGKASPLFSWLTALGRGQSMDMMIFGCFSPLNLLLLLSPRDMLLANMSYYVLIKLALSALAMAWYIQKRFPALPPVWRIFFGVAYGLSGHALMHFHNTLWLEAMILLPFYLYYAERMLLGHRLLPYALLLAGLLLINFYSAAMVCLFTFFVGGAYIVLLLPKEARGRTVVRIAAGTLLAFALSAFRTVPAGIQLLRAARLGYAGTSYLAPFTGYAWQSGFALATAAFALILLPWRLVALVRAGEKRKAAFMGIALSCMLLPLFFDGIDKIWHFGGNIGFAYRYGFITVFLVLALCAEALCACAARPAAPERPKWARVLQILVTAGICVCFAYVTLRDGRRATDYIEWKRTLLAVLTCAAGMAYLAALRLPDKRIVRGLCLAVLLLQTLCYGYSAFVADDTVRLPEASSTQAAALSAAFTETDDISRVKLEDASLTINYPKYLGRPALSSFSSSTTQKTLDTAKAMGYGVSAYAVQDCGGTLFSDALLHITSTISRSDRFMTDPAYAFRTRVGELNVYDNIYTLPFGLVGSGALSTVQPARYGDCFALQNALYTAISGDEAPLLAETDAAFAAVDEADAAAYRARFPVADCDEPASFSAATIQVSGTQRVYLYACGDTPGAKLFALAEKDGEIVRVTDEHPITYLDGIYDLGPYTDTNVTIAVAGEADELRDSVCVALLDMERFAAFTAAQNAAPAVTDVTTGKRSLTLTVTAAEDTDILFLPLQYSMNWRARLDGHAVTPCHIVGDYTGLALLAGTHTLTMSYWPAGLTAGIVCSALALAAAVWLWYKERRDGALLSRMPDKAARIADATLTAVWSAALAACYALPVIYAIPAWYRNLH